MPNLSAPFVAIVFFLFSHFSSAQTDAEPVSDAPNQSKNQITGAIVTGVVSPAWVIQQDRKIALKPGYRIAPTDTVETSTHGRVQMAFSNDAEFQLGQEAEFKAHQLERPAANNATDTEPYRGFVEVVKGAFRYIGESFGPGPQNTDFRVKVGYSTIGLRGTDFWGVTDRITDTIVLIEGAITITPDVGQPFTMDTPQTIVQAVAGQGAGPIDSVDMATLQQSAAETTLPNGQGVMTKAGRYQVILGSLVSSQKAQEYATSIDTLGYPAEVEYAAEINRNRILINGFISRADAKYFVENSAGDLGVSGAWIKRSQ